MKITAAACNFQTHASKSKAQSKFQDKSIKTYKILAKGLTWISQSKCLELERSNVKVPAYKLRVYNETSPKVYSDLGTSLDPSPENP